MNDEQKSHEVSLIEAQWCQIPIIYHWTGASNDISNEPQIFLKSKTHKILFVILSVVDKLSDIINFFSFFFFCTEHDVPIKRIVT